MGRLEDKVAFITGAASGIGSASAFRFAQEGTRIAGFDISDTPNDTWKAAVEAASESYFDTGDMRDEKRVQEIMGLE